MSDVQTPAQPPIQQPVSAVAERKVGLLLGLGIMFMPYIFGWLTLRKGHTTTAKIVSFAWMGVVMIMLATSDKKPHEDAVAADPSPAAAQPAARPEAKQEEKRAEPPPAKAAGIGDTVTFEDSAWTVVSAKNAGKKLRSNNQFQKPATTDGYFVIVRFKVTNTTNQEDRIMDHPKLIDAKGREFGTLDEQTFYLPEDAKTMTLEALPSSMSREFWAVYEVPEDASGLKFGARTLGLSGDTIPIDLGL